MIKLFLTSGRIFELRAGESVGRAPTASAHGDFVVRAADGIEIARLHSADVIGYQVAVTTSASVDAAADQLEGSLAVRPGRKRT